MSLADRGQAREQQMYFDDLAVSRGSEAYAMVLNSQLRANCIQLVANFPAGFGIRIIHQPDCRTPDQTASRPENMCGYRDSNRDRAVSSVSAAPARARPQLRNSSSYRSRRACHRLRG